MSLGVGNHTSLGQATGTTITSAGITTTVGSGLVVGVSFQGGTFVSLTDSNNNPAPVEINVELGATQHSRLFYFPRLNVAGAGHTFTATFSGNCIADFFVQEVTTTSGNGIWLDTSANGDDASSPFGDAVSVKTGIVNTILISVGHWAAGGTTNPDTWAEAVSFTMQENVTTVATTISGALGTRLVSAIGTYNASWTATQATTGRMWLASFYEPFPQSGRIGELAALGWNLPARGKHG